MKYTIYLLLMLSFLFSKESISITQSVDKNNPNIITAKAIIYLDQDIDDIFKRITDFSSYAKNIDPISKSEVYHTQGNSLKLKMTTDILAIFSLVNHFEHVIYEDIYKVTWELDNKKDNILEFAKGQWTLEDLSHNRTKVVYQNTIKTPFFIPSIINTYIVEQGVKDSTIWLMKNKTENIHISENI